MHQIPDKHILITIELRIISMIETQLDQLHSLTTSDHIHGKGFCSHYPLACLEQMKTMRTILQMELEHKGDGNKFSH